jgi:hypothetical protein
MPERGRPRPARGRCASVGPLALCTLLALGAPAAAGALGPAASWRQDAPAAAVAEAFSAGRLGRALELTAELADPLLAAEWRFHVLYSGGDLPAALAAAEAGLAREPEHPALLENAARCALALGDGSRARRHAEALASVAADPAVRARAEDLLVEARSAALREEQTRTGLARARAVASALGVAAALLMLGFARRPPARRQKRAAAGEREARRPP